MSVQRYSFNVIGGKKSFCNDASAGSRTIIRKEKKKEDYLRWPICSYLLRAFPILAIKALTYEKTLNPMKTRQFALDILVWELKFLHFRKLLSPAQTRMVDHPTLAYLIIHPLFFILFITSLDHLLAVFNLDCYNGPLLGFLAFIIDSIHFQFYHSFSSLCTQSMHSF